MNCRTCQEEIVGRSARALDCLTCADPRDKLLRSRYGISTKEFEALVASQGGVCAYCKKPPPAGKRLHVDHDHKSGLLRGALCNFCNLRKVGKFVLEDAQRLLEYLSNPPASTHFGGQRLVPAGQERPKSRRKRRVRRSKK